MSTGRGRSDADNGGRTRRLGARVALPAIALALVIGAVAVAALAGAGAALASGNECAQDVGVPQDATQETSWIGLQSDVAAVTGSATFYLDNSIASNTGNGLSVRSGASVTIDLGGCNLDISSLDEADAGILVPIGARLTIEDTTNSDVTYAGTLTAIGGSATGQGDGDGGGAGIGGSGGSGSGDNAGAVTIDSGNVIAEGGAGGDYGGGGGAGVGGGGGGIGASGNGGALVVSGGSLDATGGAGGESSGGGAGVGGGGGGQGSTNVWSAGTLSSATSITGGSVTATGGSGGGGNGGAGGAGIGGGGAGYETAAGDLTAGVGLDGGTVTATGGVGMDGGMGGGGAGIGGGGGDFGVGGGTISYAVTVAGASVTAAGALGGGDGATGAAIGGGGGGYGPEPAPGGGDGGDVILMGGALSATPVSGGVGIGGGGARPNSPPGTGGSLTVKSGSPTFNGEVAGQFTVDDDATLSVPASDELLLDGSATSAGTIDLGGAISGSGTFTNDGTITVSGSDWSVDDHGPDPVAGGPTMSGNVFELVFDVPSGSAPADQWVYAPTLGVSGETLPQIGAKAPLQTVTWFSGAQAVSSTTELSTVAIGLNPGVATLTGNAASIAAKLSSSRKKTKYGWYGAPVTVTFTCTPASGYQTTSCSSPVHLDKSAKGQSAKGSSADSNGATPSVTVSGIDIDLNKPNVEVSGPKQGATYTAKAPKASCKATEKPSGVAGCKLTTDKHKTSNGYRETITATATTKAGLSKSAAVSFEVKQR